MQEESVHRTFLRRLFLFAVASLLILPANGYPYLQQGSKSLSLTELLYSGGNDQEIPCFSFILYFHGLYETALDHKSHYKSVLKQSNQVISTKYLHQRKLDNSLPYNNLCHFKHFTFSRDKGDTEAFHHMF